MQSSMQSPMQSTLQSPMQLFGTFNSIAHNGISGIITLDFHNNVIYVEYSAGSKYRPGYIFSYPVTFHHENSGEKTITFGSAISSNPLIIGFITIGIRAAGGLKVDGKYSMLRPADSGCIQISQQCTDVIWSLWKDPGVTM